MISYMLMIVNTAVQKTWNSHVEKLLSTKMKKKELQVKLKIDFGSMKVCRIKAYKLLELKPFSFSIIEQIVCEIWNIWWAESIYLFINYNLVC